MSVLSKMLVVTVAATTVAGWSGEMDSSDIDDRIARLEREMRRDNDDRDSSYSSDKDSDDIASMVNQLKKKGSSSRRNDDDLSSKELAKRADNFFEFASEPLIKKMTGKNSDVDTTQERVGLGMEVLKAGLESMPHETFLKVLETTLKDRIQDDRRRAAVDVSLEELREHLEASPQERRRGDWWSDVMGGIGMAVDIAGKVSDIFGKINGDDDSSSWSDSWSSSSSSSSSDDWW